MRFLLPLLFLPFLLTAQTDSAQLVRIVTAYSNLNPYDANNPWRVQTDADRQEEISALSDLLADLPAAKNLNNAQRTERNLLAFVLKDELFRLRFGSHQFPFNAEGGLFTGFLYRAQNTRIRNDEDLSNYLYSLEKIPEYLEAVRADMRKGLARKRTNPSLVIDRVLSLLDEGLIVKTGDHPFMQPVAELPEHQPAVRKFLEEDVLPALRTMRRFLAEDYQPQLPPEIGISSIDGGREYYRQRVRFYTTDEEATPEQIFEIGQKEVARIRSEMEAIIERTGFDGSFAEFLEFLRTDPQFYAKTPLELLSRAAWITKKMEGELPRYFNKLPRMPLTVKPVPAAIAPNYTGGRYSGGSYSGKRAGAFLVNTYDLPSRPFYTLPALAMHEGVPGHHLQIMLAAELEGRSDFQRNLYLSAFGEGWALYAEYLAKEAGIYADDYEDFGRLTYEMWRACRLVVDPGMHYFGWSRERALEFMKSNTALSLREVTTEIDRYIGWPGQAISYKIGELKIRELRQRAEAEMGEAFDLPTFHDLILNEGAITLDMLEEKIVRWMKQPRQ